jgi:inosine-uridine nucleoside N-ribohydrolase
VALFGHDFKQPITDEYNLVKDMVASKVIMETNLPIMLVPCIDVAKKLVMSYGECVEKWQGKNEIGDYLIYCMAKMFAGVPKAENARIIWDAVPVALLVHPEWVTYEITERPWLTFDKHWLFGKNDGKILYVSDINSEAIKKDIFERIKNYE